MAEKKPINWRNVLTVYGAAILVGTELVGLTWAGAWALGGLWLLQALGLAWLWSGRRLFN